MASLIPFNRKRGALSAAGYDDFYNMLDDFFSDAFMPMRSLSRDTFKIDVKETPGEYVIEAELPGVKKDEINLSLNEGCLSIEVKRQENVSEEANGYIHRERRLSSMSRSVRLLDAADDGVKAKLDNGVLSVTVAKKEKTKQSLKIDIE